MNNKDIICVAQICRDYSLSKGLATRYVKESGLALPRAKNQKICVYREAFEKWMRSQRP